ncbi:hypothetical protein E2C01_007505 [Portunus trituberculatus]|uniref:Uncharacterized protein n=1 Tax=Portunus trituberculatus TaxID=210409 RepID=A0A5B7D1C5_PORTR|nr:hypothetical protein [Portunus trituberculatus]
MLTTFRKSLKERLEKKRKAPEERTSRKRFCNSTPLKEPKWPSSPARNFSFTDTLFFTDLELCMALTASFRWPAKDVNVPKSHSVFQELVSLDVSEGALETQLRNTLNIR